LADHFLDTAQVAQAVPSEVTLERHLLLLQSGDLESADHYVEITRKHPDFAQAPQILEATIVGSLRAMDLVRARECLDLWEARLGSPADQVQLWLWRGELHVRGADVDTAIGDFRRAVEIDPTRREARLKLVQLLAHADPSEAQEHVAWLRQAFPADADVLYQQALVQRNLGQLDAAERTLEELLAVTPDNVDGLVLRGRVALDRSQFEVAENWLTKAEELDPRRHGVLLARLDLARLTGREAEAKQYQERLEEVVRAIQLQVGHQPSVPGTGTSSPPPVAGPAPR
jgi:tetratricopeptide (TPR) repeat protein